MLKFKRIVWLTCKKTHYATPRQARVGEFVDQREWKAAEAREEEAQARWDEDDLQAAAESSAAAAMNSGSDEDVGGDSGDCNDGCGSAAGGCAGESVAALVGADQFKFFRSLAPGSGTGSGSGGEGKRRGESPGRRHHPHHQHHQYHGQRYQHQPQQDGDSAGAPSLTDSTPHTNDDDSSSWGRGQWQTAQTKIGVGSTLNYMMKVKYSGGDGAGETEKTTRLGLCREKEDLEVNFVLEALNAHRHHDHDHNHESGVSGGVPAAASSSFAIPTSSAMTAEAAAPQMAEEVGMAKEEEEEAAAAQRHSASHGWGWRWHRSKKMLLMKVGG